MVVVLPRVVELQLQHINPTFGWNLDEITTNWSFVSLHEIWGESLVIFPFTLSTHVSFLYSGWIRPEPDVRLTLLSPPLQFHPSLHNHWLNKSNCSLQFSFEITQTHLHLIWRSADVYQHQCSRNKKVFKCGEVLTTVMWSGDWQTYRSLSQFKLSLLHFQRHVMFSQWWWWRRCLRSVLGCTAHLMSAHSPPDTHYTHTWSWLISFIFFSTSICSDHFLINCLCRQKCLICDDELRLMWHERLVYFSKVTHGNRRIYSVTHFSVTSTEQGNR